MVALLVVLCIIGGIALLAKFLPDIFASIFSVIGLIVLAILIIAVVFVVKLFIKSPLSIIYVHEHNIIEQCACQ